MASEERRPGELGDLNSRIALSASGALALVAIQFASIRLAPSDAPLRVILPLTIALVPATLWPYRGHLGVWVMFVGLAANLAAVLTNGGLMPIQQRTVAAIVGDERAGDYAPGAWIAGSKDVVVARGEGRLVALGDGIVIRLRGGWIAASPGDVVIWSGLLVLAAEASVAWQRRPKPVATRPPAISRAEGSATTPT